MTVAVSNNRTSILVPSQLPEFVREDHNTFVQFVQSYYKFMENAAYEKAVKSNLKVSTKIGPAGAFQNTSVVFLDQNAALSNVAFANGAKVSINGTITHAYDVAPDKNYFAVDPEVPTRTVQGDLLIYTDQYVTANNQLMDLTKNWPRYLNIDVATTDNDQVRQRLYNNFIKVLPKNMLADKTLIAKHAKEFYRSRGSQKSVQFLLRALYGVESSFYYPKDDILRASDGKWEVVKSIRVSETKVNNVANAIVFNNFVGHKITGMDSQAEAIVEGVNVYYKNGQLITELLISNSDRPFFANEKIFSYYQDTTTLNPNFVSARIFGGKIVDTQIIHGGTGYLEGMIVPIIPTDNTGAGGQIVISKVSRGGINRIYIGANNQIGLAEFGGAGYRVDDVIRIIGGGGTGALGAIEAVWDNNYYHPNTYTLVTTTLNDVAHYHINDYWEFAPNLNIAFGTTVANSRVDQSVEYWTYGPTGPAKFCIVVDEGQDYGKSIPTFQVQANTLVQSLGILGKMKIVNGGSNYQIGDVVEFINPQGLGHGSGASANVTSVGANGEVVAVHFTQVPGQFVGGSGYDEYHLPTCNVRSSSGNGANIVVTNILATGATFSFTTESLGIIKALKIVNGGLAYNKAPILDLTGFGDGKAQVVAKSVTGIYTYAGRYKNEDGFLSSKNKLQDRDYYQNFSYVVRTEAPLNRYKPILKSLTHPAGSALFGVYEIVNVENSNLDIIRTYNSSNNTTVSPYGLVEYLDTANTVDPFTGKGYEYNLYDNKNGLYVHIFDYAKENVKYHAIATDGTAYNHPTTWVNLANMSDIGAILNGAQINQETGILSFDGTNEYAYFPINKNLNSQQLTCEVWFAPANLYENGMLFEKGFRNEQYSLLMQSNKKLLDSELIWRLNLDGKMTDVIKIRSSEFLKTGWNYAAVVHSPGFQLMYVNGKYAGSSDLVGQLPSPPAGLSIAASGPTSGTDVSRAFYFNGKIGIVRIYNRVLDLREIHKNYNYDKGRYGIGD